MFTRQIALVSEAANVDMATVARVSAALQQQVVRDLAPIWGVSATVDPFPSLDQVPPAYWPIIVTLEGLPEGDLGFHQDENGQPHAWVEWSDSWSITASHECLEMLVDPSGNQLQAAPGPNDSGTVQYLVEVCDPCQDATFAYHINDTLVSDFYTPEFFGLTLRSGARYSSQGNIQRPLQILPGGYLSFRDFGSNNWHQLAGDGTLTQLGALNLGTASLRERINGATPNHLAGTHLTADQVQQRVGAARASTKRVAAQRAQKWREAALARRTERTNR